MTEAEHRLIETALNWYMSRGCRSADIAAAAEAVQIERDAMDANVIDLIEASAHRARARGDKRAARHCLQLIQMRKVRLTTADRRRDVAPV